MNKLNVAMCLCFLFLAGFSHGEGKKYTINGKASELTGGEMLVIFNRVDRVDTIGRAPIVDGKFFIEGEIDEPCVVLLKVAQYEGGFVFLLDTDAPYKMELWKSGKSSIEGGKLQKELNTYQSIISETNKEIGKLKENMQKAREQRHYKTAGELQKEITGVQGKAQKKLDAMVERNKDNVFAAYIQTARMGSMALNELKACYASLTDKAKATEPGKFLVARMRALEGVDVNAVAPNFTLRTPEDKEVSMYEVKGKIKVIDFWASWCGPCRMENPNMVKLYQDFKDKGLTVISVSLDEKKDKWLEAIQKDGLTWLHLSDLKGWKSEVVKLYNVDGVPAIFVLDENNRIIAKNLRGEELRALVAEKLE